MIAFFAGGAALPEGASALPQYGYSCRDHAVEALKDSVTEAEAVRLSEDYLLKSFDKSDIKNAEPFTGKLMKNVWVVSGYIPPDVVGGTFVVTVDARSGCILGYQVNR